MAVSAWPTTFSSAPIRLRRHRRIEVSTSGSDPGQMAPMVEQIHERYEQYPKDVLIDGGFVKHDDIDTISAPEQGCTVYGPVPKPKDASQDRYAPRAMDSAAVAAWRQ